MVCRYIVCFININFTMTKKMICLLPILAMCVCLKAQVKEPDYVGEAYLLKEDGTFEKLEKNLADYKVSLSLKVNGTATSIFVEGASSKTKVSVSNVRLVVRAVDNNSDPLSVVSIFKFNAKKKKRTAILLVDRSETLLASRTYSKNQVRFEGEKYGNSSYLLYLNDLKEREYGIMVVNPNNQDEKIEVVSCFSVVK